MYLRQFISLRSSAEELGIKKLLPPYLDPTLQLDDLLTGVSFASGGAGFDPLTAKVASAISLSAQLELFKEYIGKVQTAVGGERMATILSKSIFIVFAGSNDIVNTYYGGPFRRVDYDLSAYTDLMVKSASSFIEELYGLGARKIGVFSIPPLGCVPSQRTVGGGLQRECAEICNQASKLFNSKISSKLNSLNSKLPYARLVYLDSYFSVLALIQNPGYYGFEEVSKGCCGTGNIEASILCNSLSPHTCTDDSKYVFWDGYHPTEKAYEIIIRMTMPSFSKFFL